MSLKKKKKSLVMNFMSLFKNQIPAKCYRLLAQQRRRVDCYCAKQQQWSWENVSICWGSHLCTKFNILKLHIPNPHIFPIWVLLFFCLQFRRSVLLTQCYLDNCWKWCSRFFLIAYLVQWQWGKHQLIHSVNRVLLLGNEFSLFRFVWWKM